MNEHTHPDEAKAKPAKGAVAKDVALTIRITKSGAESHHEDEE